MSFGEKLSRMSIHTPLKNHVTLYVLRWHANCLLLPICPHGKKRYKQTARTNLAKRVHGTVTSAQEFSRSDANSFVLEVMIVLVMQTILLHAAVKVRSGRIIIDKVVGTIGITRFIRG